MPELPEVETMVRGLRPALSGRTVRRLEVLDPTLVQGCTAEQLARRGRGATVVGVTRRGKWVVLELADDRGIIVIQPRMTGGFWLVEPGRPEHIRLAFHVDKPRATVWYCDTRRLGKVCWFPDAEAAAGAFARSHGPDALEIGRDELAGRLARTQRGIKPTLMDQKVLAGIGNIYADETLHRAGIHPERPGRDAHARGARPAASRRSARSWPPPSSWRARASTPAIARSSAWRAGSWPRTPSMDARTSPAGRAKGRS